MGRPKKVEKVTKAGKTAKKTAKSRCPLLGKSGLNDNQYGFESG
jgi:hypothetical protein